MSDEWIDGRSWRNPAYPPPLKHLPTRQPEPEEWIPRFMTTTGGLKPLTDQTIAEIESLVEEHASGQAPPGYEPRYETSTGELEPLTAETLDELVRVIRTQTERRRATWSELPGQAEAADLVREPVHDQARPQPDEPVPWLDTATGDLPPIVVEDDEEQPAEVVDAEWVKEVRVRPERAHRYPETAMRPVGPVTQQLLQAIKEQRFTGSVLPALRARRWRWWEVAILLGLIGGIALLLFSPISLPVRPQDVTPGTPGQPGDASPAPTGQSGAGAASPAPQTIAPASAGFGRVVFASSADGDFEIVVLDTATGAITPLTDNDDSDRYPAWSPDGTRLVFVSDRTGDDDLFAMNTSGGELVQLTTTPTLDRSPEWSPDGAQVAFSRESINGADLVTISADCMSQPGACEGRVQTITTGRYDLSPAWSPDGARVAFAAADFPGLPSAIGIQPLSGGDLSLLEGTGAADLDPAWSPDGQWIAFVSNRFGDYDIWVMKADGSSPAQVTRSEAGDVQPVWSPDGRYLLFASDRGEDGDFELYLIAAACALSGQAGCEDALIQLTDNADDDLDPAWIPSGG
jgi:hypothetical protein